jgi:DNA-binding MarR family transcriptional regulator
MLSKKQPGPRYQATLELLRAADSLWNASRAFFARWDLSPSQFNLLNLLSDRSAGWTQTELSRALIMHRSNVTGLIDRLEKRGLAARKPDPGDRRLNRVILTESGSRLLREVLPYYYAAAEEVWGPISAEQARAITSQLAGVSLTASRIAQSLNAFQHEA